MKHVLLSLAAVCALFAASANARAQQVGIASREAGATAISANDEYMSAANAADVAIWLHQPGAGADKEALARHLSGIVREWTPQERTRLEAMLQRLAPGLAQISSVLPEHVQIAAIRPEASGGADFTRGSTIFLIGLRATDAELDERFFHELFHVISRANAERRDQLYALVGFSRCTPMALDSALTERVLTNPDAPRVEYAAQVTVNNRTFWTTPLMVADLPRYTAQSGLFDHVDLQFVPLARDAQGRCTLDESVTVARGDVATAVIAQAGGNTDYVIHPEELVADNFAQMMTSRSNTSSPEIYDRLAGVLQIQRPAPGQ